MLDCQPETTINPQQKTVTDNPIFDQKMTDWACTQNTSAQNFTGRRSTGPSGKIWMELLGHFVLVKNTNFAPYSISIKSLQQCPSQHVGGFLIWSFGRLGMTSQLLRKLTFCTIKNPFADSEILLYFSKKARFSAISFATFQLLRNCTFKRSTLLQSGVLGKNSSNTLSNFWFWSLFRKQKIFKQYALFLNFGRFQLLWPNFACFCEFSRLVGWRFVESLLTWNNRTNDK